ncbi:PREDICTED: osteopetrosis-associated transmembrane protein 1 [Drosophila arizonae]|uniref:Osteopetrosis-associated transmembrane protein 1 n=1 Tax=Drosophila arizonae TaxID=7263 RepID=A0ABM1P2Y0_DROAR|nr:PREDICTED: osteopetrosis-associated transmembrane protein 1 [Drosophila arizonae]
MRALVSIIIIIVCIITPSLCKTCTDLLRELANAQMEFVYCNTRHALPVQDERLCNGCKVRFDEMSTSYSDLMKSCSKIYTDADRLNILTTTQSMLQSLWDRAYCEECFKNNNSGNFTSLYDSFSTCLAEHPDSKCTNCLLEYINMNNFYKNLDKESNGKMCFDMQDIMNKTRVLWSKDLKCCKREVKMSTFLTTVVVVAVLPILLLYSGAIVLTKRREANHGLLNEQEPELDAPSTSQLITAAILSTPTVPPAVVDSKFNKISNLLATRDSDLSSDDEPILHPKQSKQLLGDSPK